MMERSEIAKANLIERLSTEIAHDQADLIQDAFNDRASGYLDKYAEFSEKVNLLFSYAGYCSTIEKVYSDEPYGFLKDVGPVPLVGP